MKEILRKNFHKFVKKVKLKTKSKMFFLLGTRGLTKLTFVPIYYLHLH